MAEKAPSFTWGRLQGRQVPHSLQSNGLDKVRIVGAIPGRIDPLGHGPDDEVRRWHGEQHGHRVCQFHRSLDRSTGERWN